MLALLQQSSLSSSHSDNHLITQLKFNTIIIRTLPHHDKTEDFITDAGATDHVFFSKKITCLKIIHPITVKLPYGSLVITEFAGTILFDSHFILTNVLYMSHIYFNLI